MVSTKKVSIEYIEEYILEGNQNMSLQKNQLTRNKAVIEERQSSKAIIIIIF